MNKAGVTDNKLLHIFMPVFFAAFGDECVDAISRLGAVRRIA